MSGKTFLMKGRNGSRRIVLGMTGGIAAYKCAELVRLLKDRGHDVHVVMTPWATKFVGTLTMESLSGHAIRVETPALDNEMGIEHISLIRSADLLVIAPLTANTLAKMAMGLADNFLTTTYLAHKGKTLVCPAMNTAMLQHPATVRNLARLESDGVYLCMGETGDLACGEVGEGRMAEPGAIVDEIGYALASRLPELQHREVLISAGPTREDLDPVRYLTNRSSGKMGVALARAFRDAGANVTLVHGPIQIQPPRRVSVVPVTRAEDMAEAVLTRGRAADIIVMAAAVADYRPPTSAHKLKKEHFDGVLSLERTTDILAQLGLAKQPRQILAGFAAETENLMGHAVSKLKRKNLDFIFANHVATDGVGFGSDHNQILALNRQGSAIELGRGTKDELARNIAIMLAAALAAKNR